jgi:hypothetical protein
VTGHSQPGTTSGWNQVYWPGEDFQPPQFQAPVLLFKRPKQPYYYVRDPYMGWSERSSGGVEVCNIDCGHVEMLREPHVGMVAEKIAARLTIGADTEEAVRILPSSEQSVDSTPPLARESVA